MSTILSETTRRKASPSAVADASPPPASRRTVTPSESVGATRRDELLREVHLTRPDGGVCFATGSEAPADAARRRALLKTAVAEFGDAELLRFARAATSRTGKPAATSKGLPQPTPAYHCEALRTSVLRTDWSATAAQLAVDWSRAAPEIELVIGGDVLLRGAMPAEVTVDGRPRAATGAWEEVCWSSDVGGDYLELEVALAGGLRLQRQFALLRRDGLLWIADAVLGAAPAELQCAVQLPFGPKAVLAPADETRELNVELGRRRYLVLPAALPEWRSERRGGTIEASERLVRLERTASQATALYAPLCVVIDSARAKRECTWRQLTVGEDLRVQPADRAVGYRLQSGREQWLVYRSLTARANRSVLGVNLQTDFLVARFKKDGATDTLLEIEDT